MAARVNIKMIVILLIILIGGGGILGALWYLQMRNDAERLMRIGDEYKQQGNLRRAREHYARGVSRDPGNLDYLRTLWDTILEIKPESTDEARDLYSKRLSVLGHEIRHYPTNADAHLRMINEAHDNARLINVAPRWQFLRTVADEMYTNLPESDPKRIYARLYRGMADLRRVDTLESTEIEEALNDLQVFCEAVPDSDLGWASLVNGHMAIAEKLYTDGRTPEALEKYAEADEILKLAVESAPDGIEVAQAQVVRLILKRGSDETSVTEDELRSATEHLLSLITPQTNPWLVTEIAQALQFLTFMDGLQHSIALLKEYVESHPDAILHRYTLARNQYLAEELEDGQSNARLVIESDPLPVCFLAQLQMEIKSQAAALITDIVYRRWEMADEENKPIQIAALESARDELEFLVPNPETNLYLIRANGRLAYVQQDIEKAAHYFEELVSGVEENDPELLILSARCLNQLGQVGLAQERLEKATELRPGALPVLQAKARLEFDMRRLELAQETINQILAIEPENEEAIRLSLVIDRLTSEGESQASNPLFRALDDAQNAINEGDFDAARLPLIALLDSTENPNDQLALLNALIRLELAGGDRQAAREYLDRAFVLSPDNPQLKNIQLSLDNEDPIDWVRASVLSAFEDDEIRQTIGLIVNYRSLAAQRREFANTLEAQGKTEEAAKARETADRADAEAELAYTKAKEIAPDHPTLISSDFTTALAAEDWTKAEEILQRARELNVDNANGLLFQGQYQMVRGEYEEAIRTFTQATEVKEYAAGPWSVLAEAYQRVGNLHEARSAYEEAYRRNPTDLSIIESYTVLLLQLGERTRALEVMQQARRLAPQDRRIRDTWLSLEAELGSLELAFERRRQIYESTPEDRSNAIQLVGMLVSAEPTDELVLAYKGDVIGGTRAWERLTPNEQGALRQETKEYWHQTAHDIVNQLMAQEDEVSFELLLVKANVLLAQGEGASGEQLIIDYIDGLDESEKTVDMLIALGQFQVREGRLAKAWDTLNNAREYQDPQNLEVDDVLGRLMFSKGLTDQALAYFDNILEARYDQTIALKTAECMIKLHRFDEAQERLTQAVPDITGNHIALMLQANIAEGLAEQFYEENEIEQSDEKFSEFLAILDQAAELRPNDPLPHVLRAQGLLRAHVRTAENNPTPVYLDDAMIALNDAMSIRADYLPITITRADVLLARGDKRGAMSELDRLLEVNPGIKEARTKLVNMYLNDDRIEAAGEEIMEAIAHDPNSAQWRESLGNFYNSVLKDPQSAIDPYIKSFELEPTVLRLRKIIGASLSVPEPNYANAERIIAAHEQYLPLDPELCALYAKALAPQGKREKAIEQLSASHAGFKKLIDNNQVDPSSITTWFAYIPFVFPREQTAEAETYVLEICGDDLNPIELASLARLWLNAGKEGYSRTVEYSKRSIDACPPENKFLLARLYQELADYQMLVQNVDEAAAAYRTVVDLEPNNSQALNNYAYVLAEELNQAEEALPYAQRANELRPDNPAIQDTLGWIYYRLGQYEDARRLFVAAISQTQTASSLMHLGATLVELGEFSEAERYLRQASEMAPDPATQAEIERLTTDIRNRNEAGG